MSRDTDKSRLFTRRAVLAGGLQCGLLSMLVGRLYYLQVMQKDRYSTLADDNRVNVRLIPPSRGRIFDRNGEALAINQRNYRLVASVEQVKQIEPLISKIEKFVPLDESEKKRIKRDYKKSGALNTVMLRDNLSWEQVSAISLHMPNLSGVDIETGELRTYPFAQLASHLVGYVGSISQKDKRHKRIEFSIPGFKIGKRGVERQYDKNLRGVPGNRQLEVNARGRVVRQLAKKEPKSGNDLKLTIDVRIQKVLEEHLSNKVGAAGVVMDSYTGAIYALVSQPAFDPNLFTYGISNKDWNKLNKDPHFPLLNKVLDGVYAPGSTFKIVTALAGLEAGVISPRETVYCPGHYDLGNHRFHCWKRGGHGYTDFYNAMAWSCDTYFYELGKRIGIDRIQSMAKRLGLGTETGIDLPQERTGLVPSRTWKKATKNTAWQQGETLITAIGQGYVLASPMQLAVMTARISNGGYAITPHIVMPPDGEKKESTPNARSLGFNKRNLRILQRSLSAVVNKKRGTAHNSRILEEGMSMAGKTGTAQVRRISKVERAEGVTRNENLPWKERDHALFVGYAPVKKSRYVAAVIVEHGGSGSATAAPIVRNILEACQKIDPRKS